MFRAKSLIASNYKVQSLSLSNHLMLRADRFSYSNVVCSSALLCFNHENYLPPE
jgi:hypothetical protein